MEEDRRWGEVKEVERLLRKIAVDVSPISQLYVLRR